MIGNYKLSILIIWNLLWGGFAIDQLGMTYELVNQEKNIYGDKIVVEENGVKFLRERKDTDVDNITKNRVCRSKALWEESFNYNFDFNTSELTVEFTKSKPRNYLIERLIVKQKPRRDGYSSEYLSKGFNFLNYKVDEVKLTDGAAIIPISITKSKHEIDYPVELVLEAFSYGASNNQPCLTLNLASIHTNNYFLYTKPFGFFNSSLISSAYEINPKNISTFAEEQEYINTVVEKNRLQKLHSLLPPIHESSVALLMANVNIFNEWSTEDTIYRRPVNNVTIGLFGDVKDDDLEHLNRLLDTLKVVAPTLKIKYSDNPDLVTLPIHLTRCTEEFSDLFNDCYGSTWGTYYYTGSQNHGWIWVDSSLSTNNRLHTLTHEIGHALMLHHNLCTDSVMSYSTYADSSAIHFSYVDLMQIRTLYEPTLKIEKRKTVKRDLINQFDLNEEKINKYLDDISSACHIRPGAYDFLIDMQKNKN